MKILVIPSWHPIPQRPMWAIWVLPYIESLKENGHDVYVLQVNNDVVKKNERIEKDIIFLNDNHIYSRLPVKYHRAYRSYLFYGATLRKYSKKVQELYNIVERNWGKPDVIHAHVSLPGGYGAVLLGEKEKIPVIVSEHYSGFENDTKYFWRVGHFIKTINNKVNGFYSVSAGFAKRINDTGFVKVTGVIPNPIDTDFFTLLTKKKKEKTFHIVMTGGVSKLKGVDILFEAFSLLKDRLDCHLTVFGANENKIQFKKWFEDPDFSNRVNLPGKVAQKELVKAYSISDLYVMSSRAETANVAMLEAMACGLPVVCTRCGASETLLNDKVSIIVSNESPIEMAEAIMEMAKTQKEYNREELRKFVVENYSKKAVADKMLKAYNLAINNQNMNKLFHDN